DKSAWWRSSMWRLGAALAADGKDAEALNSYIESYKTDKPDFAKYAVVEALYRKVNGNTDGLEEKIGRDRIATVAAVQEVQPTPTPVQIVEAPLGSAPIEAPAVSGSPTPAVREAAVELSKAAPDKSAEKQKTEPAASAKIAEPITETPVTQHAVEPETKLPPKQTQLETTTEIPKPVADTKVAEAKITAPKTDRRDYVTQPENTEHT